jgi:hypothetical protein
MPTRIGNRSYPPVVSDEQKGVMADLLNDPGWSKLRIGNRTYPDETTGVGVGAAPPIRNTILPSVHSYAQGLGKTANDLSLDELNQFIDQHYGAMPAPKQMYRLPRNYD